MNPEQQIGCRAPTGWRAAAIFLGATFAAICLVALAGCAEPMAAPAGQLPRAEAYEAPPRVEHHTDPELKAAVERLAASQQELSDALKSMPHSEPVDLTPILEEIRKSRTEVRKIAGYTGAKVYVDANEGR